MSALHSERTQIALSVSAQAYRSMARVSSEHLRVAQARLWSPPQAVPTVGLLGAPALTKAEGHGWAGKRAVAVLPRSLCGPFRGG